MKSYEERLFGNFIIGNKDECWTWNGSIKKDGYGQISKNGRTILAHRAVYEKMIGKIPKGMFLCHKCDNPSCVNPYHMFIGTHIDNMVDMIKKGRSVGNKKGNFSKPFLGKKHTEKSNLKNSIANSGKNNMMFGRRWIYNKKTKINKIVPGEELEMWIDKGWKLGINKEFKYEKVK